MTDLGKIDWEYWDSLKEGHEKAKEEYYKSVENFREGISKLEEVEKKFMQFEKTRRIEQEFFDRYFKLK